MTKTLTVEEIEEYRKRMEIYAFEQGFKELSDSKWPQIFDAAKAGLEMGWRDINDAPKDGDEYLLMSAPYTGGHGRYYDIIHPKAVAKMIENANYDYFARITPPERGQS